MSFISIKTHEMKMWWNPQTFLFSSKGIPSTPRHTDSHPCTRQGLRGASRINAWINLLKMELQTPSDPTPGFFHGTKKKLHSQNRRITLPVPTPLLASACDPQCHLVARCCSGATQMSGSQVRSRFWWTFLNIGGWHLSLEMGCWVGFPYFRLIRPLSNHQLGH